MPNQNVETKISEDDISRVVAFLISTKHTLDGNKDKKFFIAHDYDYLYPLSREDVVTIFSILESREIIDKIYPYGTMPCSAAITLNGSAYTYLPNRAKAETERIRKEKAEKQNTLLEVGKIIISIAAIGIPVCVSIFLSSK